MKATRTLTEQALSLLDLAEIKIYPLLGDIEFRFTVICEAWDEEFIGYLSRYRDGDHVLRLYPKRLNACLDIEAKCKLEKIFIRISNTIIKGIEFDGCEIKI